MATFGRRPESGSSAALERLDRARRAATRRRVQLDRAANATAPRLRSRRRAYVVSTVLIAAVAGLSACGGDRPLIPRAGTTSHNTRSHGTSSNNTSSNNTSSHNSSSHGTTSTNTARAKASAKAAAVTCSGPVHLAFGGDVNTANESVGVLGAGLGAAGQVLSRADRSMVNVETVLADDRSGLVRAPKEYNFLAPTRLLDVLHRSGVDVVTVANNHGEDFGPVGLERTLAARSPTRPTIIGAGSDADAAFAPARSTVRGRGVVFFAATDVIDDGLPWAATATEPGLASIKSATGLNRLRSAIRQDRAARPCDVISVYLHAGVELNVCPTERQRLLVSDLAADGANVVVMSHAHVVQPGVVVGNTAVSYGLGNFVFAGHSGLTSRTGVLTVDVPASGPPTQVWHPGRIVDGQPSMLTGASARDAARQWQSLIASC